MPLIAKVESIGEEPITDLIIQAQITRPDSLSETKEVSTTHEVESGHTIYVIVDFNDLVYEKDESNNGAFVIIDTTPPEVSAAFIPIEVEEEEGLFEIKYSATDNCDPDPDTTGVILTPQLINPEVEFHVEEEIKLEYDLEKNEVEVKGPNPEALWQEIQELGGLRVEGGQQVYIESEEESEEVEIKKGKSK